MAKIIIYAVSTGSYSDYGIVGLFSTKKVAEAVAERLSSSEGRVEEYILNEGVNCADPEYKNYQVLMLKNGNVEEIREQDYTYEIINTFFIWNRPKVSDPEINKKPIALQANVWAKDEKHAIKIANEKRGILIATGKWDE